MGHAKHQVQCTACGRKVTLRIPVIVEIDNDTSSIRARVDDSVDWEQPLWDHALRRHGPNG